MSLLLALTAAGGGAVNYTLACDAGSYTYTGQAASLPVSHTLVCDAGAYVYAGIDATLTYLPGATTVNYTLACDAGSYVYTGQAATLSYVSNATQQEGGGWMPPRGRRKTRKEVYAERVRLGILPPAIVRAAEKVAVVAETVEEFKADRPRYEEMFMRELSITKWSPDYTRAIQIQIELMQQDDEDVLLLMM